MSRIGRKPITVPEGVGGLVAGDGDKYRADGQHEQTTAHRNRAPHGGPVGADQRQQVRTWVRPGDPDLALDPELVAGAAPLGQVGRHHTEQRRGHDDKRPQRRSNNQGERGRREVVT